MKAQELRQEYNRLWTELNNSIKSLLKEDEEVIWGVDKDKLNLNEIPYNECYVEPMYYEAGVCDTRVYDCWILGIRKNHDGSLDFLVKDVVDKDTFWWDYVEEDARLWILERLENLN